MATAFHRILPTKLADVSDKYHTPVKSIISIDAPGSLAEAICPQLLDSFVEVGTFRETMEKHRSRPASWNERCDMQIPNEIKLGLYRTMIRSRCMEEVLLKLYKDGQVPSTLHLNIGQEAVAVGVIGAMRKDDLVLATHRGHCHALAKGVTSREIIAEVLGRATGCCGGMGGSMHLSDPDKGFLLTTSIVATNVPIGAGVGYALNYWKQDRVVVVFIGDGATNNGDFHEGLNLAAIWGAPLLLVIENNLYAISVSVKRSTKIDRLSTRAESYGIAGHTVDGMNVFEVYKTAKELIDRIRLDRSPIVLEAMTCRFLGHFAGEVIQPYRNNTEVEECKKRDPILLAKNQLLSESVLTEREAAEIEEDAASEVQDAAEFARSSPYPDLEAMYRNT